MKKSTHTSSIVRYSIIILEKLEEDVQCVILSAKNLIYLFLLTILFAVVQYLTHSKIKPQVIKVCVCVWWGRPYAFFQTNSFALQRNWVLLSSTPAGRHTKGNKWTKAQGTWVRMWEMLRTNCEACSQGAQEKAEIQAWRLKRGAATHHIPEKSKASGGADEKWGGTCNSNKLVSLSPWPGQLSLRTELLPDFGNS